MLAFLLDNLSTFADSFSVLSIHCIARGLGTIILYKCACIVQWFPATTRLSCSIRLSCRWSQVELSWYEGQEKVDLTDYVNSGTWDIIACPGRNEKPSDNADDDGEFSVSQITFTLRIRRKVQLDA